MTAWKITQNLTIRWSRTWITGTLRPWKTRRPGTKYCSSCRKQRPKIWIASPRSLPSSTWRISGREGRRTASSKQRPYLVCSCRRPSWRCYWRSTTQLQWWLTARTSRRTQELSLPTAQSCCTGCRTSTDPSKSSKINICDILECVHCGL